MLQRLKCNAFWDLATVDLSLSFFSARMIMIKCGAVCVCTLIYNVYA